jgi:hypothetical protein
MHQSLGTWEDPLWKPWLEDAMTDEETRLAYN